MLCLVCGHYFPQSGDPKVNRARSFKKRTDYLKDNGLLQDPSWKFLDKVREILNVHVFPSFSNIQQIAMPLHSRLFGLGDNFLV